MYILEWFDSHIGIWKPAYHRASTLRASVTYFIKDRTQWSDRYKFRLRYNDIVLLESDVIS